jgi:hypothetical protein
MRTGVSWESAGVARRSKTRDNTSDIGREAAIFVTVRQFPVLETRKQHRVCSCVTLSLSLRKQPSLPRCVHAEYEFSIPACREGWGEAHDADDREFCVNGVFFLFAFFSLTLPQTASPREEPSPHPASVDTAPLRQALAPWAGGNTWTY